VDLDELRALEYAVVDVETTGGSAGGGDRITEIAVVGVRGDGEVLETFSSLVNPGRPIPPFISSLTGITNAMVRVAPTFAEVADHVAGLLRGRIFVAHNASFDWGFVDWELASAVGSGLEVMSLRRLCTVRLARRVVPELKRRSLGTLSDYFGVENTARHRALGDAQATAVVFGHLLARLEEREIRSWSGLEELLGRGTARSHRRSAEGRQRRR
jgi:DNA polymerase-3 subunit epsilon